MGLYFKKARSDDVKQPRKVKLHCCPVASVLGIDLETLRHLISYNASPLYFVRRRPYNVRAT